MVKLSKWWSVAILLLPFLNIYYFNSSNIEPIILIWQCILVVITTALIYRYTNLFILWLIVYEMITLFSAIIHNTITLGIFYSMITLICICIYITFALNNFNQLIKGLYFLYSSIIIINFILMLLYPDGISETIQGNSIHLLGGKNAIQMIVLFTIPIVFLYSYSKYKKITIFPLMVITVCILSMYFSKSGNGIALSILFTIFIIFHKKIPCISFRTYFFIYVLSFFSIVVFRLQDLLLGNFIEKVLNKDLSFTGRTYIWDLILQNIENFWFLGLGRGNSFIQNNNIFNINEAHNGFFELILSSGIVGLASFIVIISIVQKKLDLFKDHIISKVLSFSIIAYMILGLTESVFNKIEFWLLMVISYNIDKIINQKNKTA